MERLNAWALLEKLTWQDLLGILVIFMAARLLVMVTRWILKHTAEWAPDHWRLTILRLPPIFRILIDIGAVMLAIGIAMEPTAQNFMIILASLGLALAFALKDYVSSMIAGLVVVAENVYQTGDWIEVDGIYGEVKTIGLRAVYLVTPDDTEVIVPHTKIWSTNFFNASSGNRSLLCVTDFYLHPDHDATAVRRRLEEIAQASLYRKPETATVVIVLEKPWGTHYRVKAYARESREQFLLISDLTVRSKEALVGIKVRFAVAPYAVGGKG